MLISPSKHCIVSFICLFTIQELEDLLKDQPQAKVRSVSKVYIDEKRLAMENNEKSAEPVASAATIQEQGEIVKESDVFATGKVTAAVKDSAGTNSKKNI